MKAGFVEVPAGGPPAGPRNGDAARCQHCPIVVRYKNGAWVHSIRNRTYDHPPTPEET